MSGVCVGFLGLGFFVFWRDIFFFRFVSVTVGCLWYWGGGLILFWSVLSCFLVEVYGFCLESCCIVFLRLSLSPEGLCVGGLFF